LQYGSDLQAPGEVARAGDDEARAVMPSRTPNMSSFLILSTPETKPIASLRYLIIEYFSRQS
jgi:hypothetical protein